MGKSGQIQLFRSRLSILGQPPRIDPVIQSLVVRRNIPDHTLKATFLTTKLAF